MTVAEASALFAADNFNDLVNTSGDFNLHIVDDKGAINIALGVDQGVQILQAAFEVTATNVSIADAAEVDDTASTPDSFGDVVDFVELNPSVFSQAPFSVGDYVVAATSDVVLNTIPGDSAVSDTLANILADSQTLLNNGALVHAEDVSTLQQQNQLHRMMVITLS